MWGGTGAAAAAGGVGYNSQLQWEWEARRYRIWIGFFIYSLVYYSLPFSHARLVIELDWGGVRVSERKKMRNENNFLPLTSVIATFNETLFVIPPNLANTINTKVLPDLLSCLFLLFIRWVFATQTAIALALISSFALPS